MSDNEINLLATTDAGVWAKEFCRIHGGDEGLMISWFANMWAAIHDPLTTQIENWKDRAESSEHNFSVEHDEVKRLTQELQQEREKTARLLHGLNTIRNSAPANGEDCSYLLANQFIAENTEPQESGE